MDTEKFFMETLNEAKNFKISEHKSSRIVVEIFNTKKISEFNVSYEEFQEFLMEFYRKILENFYVVSSSVDVTFWRIT